MFGKLREPGGGWSLIAAGMALLALSGILAGALPAAGRLGLFLVLPAAGVVCLALGWRRRQADRYDLKRLFDAPPPEPEEPDEDTVSRDAVGAPYCGWCDEAHPPGAYRCRRCGRELS